MSVSRLLLALIVTSVNSQDILVPSSEDTLTTQHSVVLPMTLECFSTRHKYIEIRGVTLLNGTDVLIASSLAPNIERLTNEECFATLVQSENEPAKCDVAMQALPKDGSIEQMDKVVTFDCRKSLGDSSDNEKTNKTSDCSQTLSALFKLKKYNSKVTRSIFWTPLRPTINHRDLVSKKRGTINIKCDNKDSVPEIIKISLASGEHVDKVSTNWKCSQENIDNLANTGNGGHCQIRRDGYLNESEMTVKYKCSEPPRRDFEEFVQGNRNRGNGKRKKGNEGKGNQNGNKRK